jgi:hypothetical protein
MDIEVFEVVDCKYCAKMILDKEAIWMESQFDKEVYPYCCEECALKADSNKLANMIDDAHERARDKRDGL